MTDIVNFLSDTFHRGVGYESVNTARGALSSLGIVLDGCRAGNHPLVNRLLRGIFNLRPSTPRDLGRPASAPATAEHGAIVLSFAKGTHPKTCDANGAHTSSQNTNITFVTVARY